MTHFNQKEWNKKVSEVMSKTTMSLVDQFQNICVLVKEAYDEGQEYGYECGLQAGKAIGGMDKTPNYKGS